MDVVVSWKQFIKKNLYDFIEVFLCNYSTWEIIHMNVIIIHTNVIIIHMVIIQYPMQSSGLPISIRNPVQHRFVQTNGGSTDTFNTGLHFIIIITL